jgi:transposase InsO family protein
MSKRHPLAGMQRLCDLFGKRRQSWYEAIWQQEDKHLQEAAIIQEVLRIRVDLPSIGTEKLYFLLADFLIAHQIKLGRDKLRQLLRAHNLTIKRKRSRVVTTFSAHGWYTYPNLIKNLVVTAPNQVWVSDLTYIHLTNGFNYLSLITDAYSRKIVGWSLQKNMHTKGPIEALEMALKELKGKQYALTHHSDRGTQYCSNSYIKLLKEHHIQISMATQGDPYENALAERVNRILKEEFHLNALLINFEKALEIISYTIEKYNCIRPHSSCDFLTPKQAHDRQGQLKKRWEKRNKLPGKVPIEICE